MNRTIGIVPILQIEQALLETPQGIRAVSSAWSSALDSMTLRAWSNVRIFLLGARAADGPEKRPDYDFVLGIAAMHLAAAIRSGSRA